jgi:hypothetical protein
MNQEKLIEIIWIQVWTKPNLNFELNNLMYYCIFFEMDLMYYLGLHCLSRKVLNTQTITLVFKF